MRHKFVSKCAVILLAFSCMAAFADEQERALLAATDIAAIKNFVVYISEEQNTAGETRLIPVGGADLITLAYTQSLREAQLEEGRSEFPPEGTRSTVREFENIN